MCVWCECVSVCGVCVCVCVFDQAKRTDQPTGQHKTSPNPNPNTNTKCVLIHYVVNAGPFFSFDPVCVRACVCCACMHACVSFCDLHTA